MKIYFSYLIVFEAVTLLGGCLPSHAAFGGQDGDGAEASRAGQRGGGRRARTRLLKKMTMSPTTSPSAAPVTSPPTIAPVTSSPTTAPVTSPPTIAPITASPTTTPVTSEPSKAPSAPPVPALSGVAITNDVRWYDQNGVEITCNDGDHITKLGNTYYWVGNDLAIAEQGNDIHMFSSTSLGNDDWFHEGRYSDVLRTCV